METHRAVLAPVSGLLLLKLTLFTGPIYKVTCFEHVAHIKILLCTDWGALGTCLVIIKLIHFLYTAITIMVGDKTIEELEREVAEAERQATEAKLRAKQLREQVKDAKRRSASSGY